MPSTTTVSTGICWASPPLRRVTVSVSLPEIPVIMATLLKILTVNHGGLR